MSGRFPVQEVRCLWELTQARLHERSEHPGHLYFDALVLHSSHRLGFGLSPEAAADCSGFSSIKQSAVCLKEIISKRAGIS